MLGWLKTILEKLNIRIGDFGNIKAKITDTLNFNFSRNKSIIQMYYNNLSVQSNDLRSLLEQATKTANENTNFVAQGTQKLLKAQNVTANKVEEKFKNPAFVCEWAEAYRIAGTLNDINKRKMLSDLLYKKIISEDATESNILNLAIKAMELFSIKHLKTIAFLYLIRSNYIKKTVKLDEFEEFYNKYISKLIDFSIDEAQDLGFTIIANGAAIAVGLGADIHSFLPDVLRPQDAMNGKVSPKLKSLVAGMSCVWIRLAFSSAHITPLGKCLAERYLYDILGLRV